MGVAETDCIAVVGPYVVEDAFYRRASNDETELCQHGGKDVTSKSGLNDVGSIKTVDTTARQLWRRPG